MPLALQRHGSGFDLRRTRILHEGAVYVRSLSCLCKAKGMAPEVESFSGATDLELSDLQRDIREIYGVKDQRRGVEGTFMWFMQEVGELASALRGGTPEEQAAEFADVLAWLATLANGANVDLTKAIQAKYGGGCPGCQKIPCACDNAAKP